MLSISINISYVTLCQHHATMPLLYHYYNVTLLCHYHLYTIIVNVGKFSQFFRRKSAIPARWAALTWSADLVWPIAWLGGFMLNRIYLMNISIDFIHIIRSCDDIYWSCYIMFMRKIPNWLKVGFGVFHKSNCFPILNIFLRLLTSPRFWIQRAETSQSKQEMCWVYPNQVRLVKC